MTRGPFQRALPAAVRLPRHEGAYLARGNALGTALDAVLDGVRYDGPSSGLRGLVAPHIDLHRGWEAYGHAYSALRACPGQFEVFVILGTAHQSVRTPFILTNHAFRTPFGDLCVETEGLSTLRGACGDGIFDESAAHVDEHSIEFQTLFLAHHATRRGGPMPRILPILCGYPARGGVITPRADTFLGALGGVLRDYGDRACVIAAVDLAHVGPQFGDPLGLGEPQRAALRAADKATFSHVESLDSVEFWNDVTRDGNARRICGLCPLYAFLEVIRPRASAGHLLRYDQAVDADGNVVSYAAAVVTA